MNELDQHSLQLRWASASPSDRCSPGFTLLELLVVISMMALLVSLLLPAVGSAKAKARGVKCLSTLRQIGLGIQLYADSDTRGLLPTDPRGPDSPAWIELLQPHLADVESVRTCPSDPLFQLRRNWKRTSYVLNEYTSGGGAGSGISTDGKASAIVFPDGEAVDVFPNLQKISLFRRPSETFLVFEVSNIGTRLPGPGEAGERPIYDDHTHPDTWVLGWPHVLADIDPYRHGASAVYSFADGHVANVPAVVLKKRIDAGDNFAKVPE